MLVITGPGRSGTSVLARFCQQMGYDPGGAWCERVDAGLEDERVVRINDALVRSAARGADIDHIVSTYREPMADIRRAVVKDPRFTFHPHVLRAWQAARGDLRVLYTYRTPEHCLRSRQRVPDMLMMRHARKAPHVLRHDLADSIEVLLDLDIPFRFLLFPKFLTGFEQVHAALCELGIEVPYAEGLDVWRTIVDYKKVHVTSAGSAPGASSTHARAGGHTRAARGYPMPWTPSPRPAPSGRPPIVVIGMHRSGTSMVSRMLQSLGLFMGTRQDANAESLFFMQLNEWVLNSAGGRWDHPSAVQHLYRQPELSALTAEYLRLSTQCPRAAGYLGVRRYLRYRDLGNLDFAWGWKDPRNNFTLPFWLSAFPNARIVRIFRHGVDVARSCQVAYAPRIEGLEETSRHFHRRRHIYALHPMRSGFVHGLRVATMEGAFSLWEEYSREGRARVAELGEQAIQFQYEDFLARPEDNVARLADFCGLPATDRQVRQVAAQVDKTRAFAFLENPELRDLADSIADRLAEFGYGPKGIADRSAPSAPPDRHGLPRCSASD